MLKSREDFSVTEKSIFTEKEIQMLKLMKDGICLVDEHNVDVCSGTQSYGLSKPATKT